MRKIQTLYTTLEEYYLNYLTFSLNAYNFYQAYTPTQQILNTNKLQAHEKLNLKYN